MIRVIQPGETGVDFAYSKPPPARLVELGYAFVVGYCSSNASKNLLNPLDYVKAGLGVTFVFELSATRPNGGRAAGLIDGAFAKAWLQGCGYPIEATVIFAFDTNTTAANIALHVAYFNAAAETSAPYSVGGYLDTDLAAAVDEAVGWLPLAWSWSGASKADAEQKARALGYHVLQGKGSYIDNQWNVDPNLAIRSFATWGIPRPAPHTDGQPQPANEEFDVQIASNQETRQMPWGLSAPGTEIFVIGEFRRSIGAEEYKKLYNNVLPIPLTNELLDRIPEYTATVAPQPPPVPAMVVFPTFRLSADVLAGGKLSGSVTPL